MMAAEDNYDQTPTPLDLIRLEDLDIGDGMNSECGKWSVFRYENEFLLFFEDGRQLDYPNITSIIRFLSN